MRRHTVWKQYLRFQIKFCGFEPNFHKVQYNSVQNTRKISSIMMSCYVKHHHPLPKCMPSDTVHVGGRYQRAGPCQVNFQTTPEAQSTVWNQDMQALFDTTCPRALAKEFSPASALHDVTKASFEWKRGTPSYVWSRMCCTTKDIKFHLSLHSRRQQPAKR